MWYVCRGHTAWDDKKNAHTECLNIITSKKWGTLYEDPMAPGQRWTCPCGTRYRAGFGVICEINVKGLAGTIYMKAEVPDQHVEDSRAVFYEKKFGAQTTQELYNMVPVCAPTLGNIIFEKDAANGVYGITAEDDAKLATFAWYQIFNMRGATLPQKIKKGKK